MSLRKIIYLDRFGTVGGVGRTNVELLPALSEIVPTELRTPPYHAEAYAKRLAGVACEVNALYPGDNRRYLDVAYWLEKYKVGPNWLNDLYLSRSAPSAGSQLLVNYPQVYEPPSKRKIEFSSLIYDLNWRRFPENFEAPQEIDARCRKWVELSEKIFTISEVTRDEVLEEYGIDPERVIAAPLSHFSNGWKDLQANTGPWSEEDYWLYPAALAVHKGHDFLADALLKGKMRHPVVLTCRMPDASASAYQAELLPKFKKLIEAGRLRVTGYTSEAEYRKLVENAKGYLLPSRYEGYGLPLVEALALGKPVVASDINAFRVICGRYDCEDAVETFSLESVDSLLAAADKVVSANEIPRKVDLSSWTWKHTAQRIVDGLNR